MFLFGTDYENSPHCHAYYGSIVKYGFDYSCESQHAEIDKNSKYDCGNKQQPTYQLELSWEKKFFHPDNFIEWGLNCNIDCKFNAGYIENTAKVYKILQIVKFTLHYFFIFKILWR